MFMSAPVKLGVVAGGGDEPEVGSGRAEIRIESALSAERTANVRLTVPGSRDAPGSPVLRILLRTQPIVHYCLDE